MCPLGGILRKSAWALDRARSAAGGARKVPAALLLIAGVCAGHPSTTGAATISGLAAFRGDFQVGVRIYALTGPDFEPSKQYSRVSRPSDTGGRFAMEVEPGRYYFVAFKKNKGTAAKYEPGDWYCFFSGNPVQVREGISTHVGFNLIRIPGDGEVYPGFTGLEGILTFEGKPLGKSYLYVYHDVSDEFRGMGFYVAPIGPEGRFKVKLPPGRYYLIGRQRQEGGMYGPIKKNDKVGYYYANPVEVVPEKTRNVTLEVISRVEMLEESGFETEAAGAFTVSGMIKDTGGKPLPGVRVLLYDNRGTSGKPRYVSPVTGPDGLFAVKVQVEGVYYLVAREGLGGPPGEGEFYGRREDVSGKPVALALGSANPSVSVSLIIRKYSPPVRDEGGPRSSP